MARRYKPLKTRDPKWGNFKTHSRRPTKKAGVGTVVLVVIFCGIVGAVGGVLLLIYGLSGGGRHNVGGSRTSELATVSIEQILTVIGIAAAAGMIGGVGWGLHQWFQVRRDLRKDDE